MIATREENGSYYNVWSAQSPPRASGMLGATLQAPSIRRQREIDEAKSSWNGWADGFGSQDSQMGFSKIGVPPSYPFLDHFRKIFDYRWWIIHFGVPPFQDTTNQTRSNKEVIVFSLNSPSSRICHAHLGKINPIEAHTVPSGKLT